jgi:hypothetical protein
MMQFANSDSSPDRRIGSDDHFLRLVDGEGDPEPEVLEESAHTILSLLPQETMYADEAGAGDAVKTINGIYEFLTHADDTPLPAAEEQHELSINFKLNTIYQILIDRGLAKEDRRTTEERRQDLTTRARRTQATVYLHEKYVQKEDVIDGVISREIDPYVERSTYFLVEEKQENGEKNHAATARQIRITKAEKKQGILSLPVLNEFNCDPEIIKQVAHVSKVGDLRPSEVVEISALASLGGKPSDIKNLGPVIELYTRMLRSSLEEGHKLWVMGTDRRLTRKLSQLVGGDLFVKMGESKDYFGSLTDPACLNPSDVVADFLLSDEPRRQPYRNVLIKGLEGVDASRISSQLRHVLTDAGVSFTVRSKAARVYESRKPEIAGLAFLLGWTALKAAPLAGGAVPEFHGSVPIFYAWDVGTAPTYAAGMSWMLRKGSNLAKRITGTGLATGSFVAPYVYLYEHGQGYPGYVNGAVGAFVAIALGNEISTRRSNQKKEKKLNIGLKES